MKRAIGLAALTVLELLHHEQVRARRALEATRAILTMGEHA